LIGAYALGNSKSIIHVVHRREDLRARRNEMQDRTFDFQTMLVRNTPTAASSLAVRL
jgi:thioredoxin reductase